MIPSGWSDWRGTSLPPEDRDPDLHRGGAPAGGLRHDVQGTFGPRFRYVEQIIERDAPIFALGQVSRMDPALYSAEDIEGEDVEEAAGVDGGDDASWQPEPDRLGIAPTSDAVVAADMSRARWVIGAAKGQPFLISTEHPGAVSAEQELGAKGGMIMGAIFAGLALVLAWVRLAP